MVTLLRLTVSEDRYWDRKGEVSPGQAEYYQAAVYYYYKNQVIAKYAAHLDSGDLHY